MDEPGAKLGWRKLTALAGQALALGWRSSGWLCVAALSAQALTSITPAAVAWSTKLLVDGVTAHASASRLITLAGMVVGIGGAGTVLGYLANLANSAQQRAIALRLDDELFRAVNALRGLRQFENPDFQDQLRLAQQSGTAAPGAAVAFGLALVRTVVTVGGFLGALLLVWWPMALLLSVTAVPAIFGQLALTRSQARTAEQMVGQHRLRFTYQSMLTHPAAFKEVRLFGLGALFRKRMIEGLRETNRREQAMDTRTAVIQIAFVVLSVAAAALATMAVAARAARGLASAGDVVLFVGATAGILSAMNGAVGQLGSTVRSVRLFRHFRAIVDGPPDLSDGDGDPGPLTDAIEFHDVWFRYHDDAEWVLQGVSLRIPAGTAVALVGKNGVGKSTIVKLLCRFYDPQRGRITWDGVDLRTLSADDLRRRIGATFQDFVTYDLTAAENIGVGSTAYLDDRPRIAAAARLAEADTMIEGLPRGYDTLLSRLFYASGGSQEAGVALSGGQAQRIAFARSLMRDYADLLILDEPSAGLDAVAESRIQQTLRAHRQGRTTILISHRLNAVRDADMIAVLEDGQIAELGTHDELMAVDGDYATMFGLQASGYQDDRVSTGSPVPEGVMRVMARPEADWGAPMRIMPASAAVRSSPKEP